MLKTLAIATMTLVALNGCKAQKAGSNAADTVPDTQLIVNEMPVPGAQTIASAMPRAIVYRTVADYRDKVPVNIDQRTGAIVSYPDPRDLHAEAMPLPLANGYLLDRRGISPSVAFTSFTYAEYAALQAPPAMEQLKKSIINKHPIVEMYQLPISAADAAADTTKVNAFIKAKFDGCKSLVLTLSLDENLENH